MFADYAIAVVGVVAASAVWVGVQIAWRRAFPEAGCDPDALAGRSGCHGCTGTEDCDRRSAGRTGAVGEEGS